MKKLFKNANIITHDGDLLHHQDVLVHDGIIESVGQNSNDEVDEVFDCTDKFIAPGFTAMHVHSPMNIFKSKGGNSPMSLS